MTRPSTPSLILTLPLLCLACASESTIAEDGVGLSDAETSTQDVTVPSGFTDSVLVNGLVNPTAMEFAPDGRLFVCEQGGSLRVIKNGALLPAPFLTVPVSSVGERGLLGLAFDPAFATNHFVYVYYTATTPALHNRVSRFTANGDVAVASSEAILLELNSLSAATNHNGGALHFGKDGKLFIAVGENANGANAQSLTNLLGKMLRINSDGTIPNDNPFASRTTGQNRAIWALGLRNPFTFAIHPVTGRILINDAGENTFEEVNEGLPGANYGWPRVEGIGTDAAFKNPLHVYGHGTTNTTGCVISGGTFYSPSVPRFPAQVTNSYFFADVCGGWVRRFDFATNKTVLFATGFNLPVDLKVGPDGAMYVLSRGDSAVHRVAFSSVAVAPVITAQPMSRSVNVGQSVTLSVTATGSGPLSFRWQRNGASIATATSASFTLPAAGSSDNGASFKVVVSNAAGSVTSNAATLTVVVGQPVAISFAADVQPIFNARCGGCHIAGSAGGLSLAVGSAQANLVNVATGCDPTVPRVTPGSTTGSMLWRKLGGSSTQCGSPMPLGSAGLKTLAPAEFLKVEQWILQGAKAN